ncbi:unnamed protein product, partial [marine sediment metagenome]
MEDGVSDSVSASVEIAIGDSEARLMVLLLSDSNSDSGVLLVAAPPPPQLSLMPLGPSIS